YADGATFLRRRCPGFRHWRDLARLSSVNLFRFIAFELDRQLRYAQRAVLSPHDRHSAIKKEEYIMQTFTKVGLDALLTPENCVLLLIDHQPFQLANINSHAPTIVINNVTALFRTAKAYD